MAPGAGIIFEKGLYDAVFQRMKAHNHKPPVRIKPAGRTFKAVFKFFQLIVDGNPECLKCPGCRVNGIWGFMNDRINDFGQFFGCLNGFILTRLDNPGSNPA